MPRPSPHLTRLGSAKNFLTAVKSWRNPQSISFAPLAASHRMAKPPPPRSTASIPLLRNAGMVNLEPLISSEREMVYAVRTFELYRRNFVVNVATQYFNLLTEQQSIADNAANLLSLQGLTERTEAMSAAGRLSYIDVQRSLQQQLRPNRASSMRRRPIALRWMNSSSCLASRSISPLK